MVAVMMDEIERLKARPKKNTKKTNKRITGPVSPFDKPQSLLTLFILRPTSPIQTHTHSAYTSTPTLLLSPYPFVTVVTQLLQLPALTPHPPISDGLCVMG